MKVKGGGVERLEKGNLLRVGMGCGIMRDKEKKRKGRKKDKDGLRIRKG